MQYATVAHDAINQSREWLSLAATPTFAIMALYSGMQEGCMPGMIPMYALMSLFHASPWLRLLSAGRSAKDSAVH